MHPERINRVGTLLLILGGITGAILAILVGGFLWFHREPDQTELTRQFVNDLYLRVSPRPAERGAVVRVFVQGEPPIKLRARRYLDLLSTEGQPIFRLDAAVPGEAVPDAVPYPLPADYEPPSGTEPLQLRQQVRLPAEIEPGKYELQGYIFGHDRFEDNAPHKGTPSWELPIVARR